MRALLFAGILLMAVGLAYGQLIIDEDDPAGKKLIELMMKAINEHEKPTHYSFKHVVYSIPIGDNKKIQVLIKVTNSAGVEHTCTVDLLGSDIHHYAAGNVHCKA